MSESVTNISSALLTIANEPLSQAAPETLIEVALLVWYTPDPFPLLKRTLEALDGIRQLRARFLLDALRRYPCIDSGRRQMLHDLADPKVSYRQGPLRGLLRAWGLDDIDRPNTKAILPYQTRHHARASLK